MADKSDIGKVGKPVTLRIEAGKIREFAKAIKDPNPLYFDEASAKAERGGIMPPPTFLMTIAHWIGHRIWDANVYLFDRIPVDFEPKVIGLALVATFVITLLCAFLASLRVTRLDPVEALRHE